MKITARELEQVRARKASYEKLERRATDLVGWITLGMGVTRKRAAALLNAAEVMVP